MHTTRSGTYGTGSTHTYCMQIYSTCPPIQTHNRTHTLLQTLLLFFSPVFGGAQLCVKQPVLFYNVIQTDIL